MAQLLKQYYQDPQAALAQLSADRDRYGIAATLERIEQNPATIGALAGDPARSARIVTGNVELIDTALSSRAIYENALRQGLEREQAPLAKAPDRSHGDLTTGTTLHQDAAPQPGRARTGEAAGSASTGADPLSELSTAERAAYDAIVDAGKELEREQLLRSAHEQVHKIRDQLAHLEAAESSLTEGRAELKRRLSAHFADPEAASRKLDSMIEKHGYDEAAKRIRSNPRTLGRSTKLPLIERLRRRGPKTTELGTILNQEVRSLGARAETLRHHAQAKDGAATITGADAVRAALRRQEQEILASAKIPANEFRALRNQPSAMQRAEMHIQALSPEGRAKVSAAVEKTVDESIKKFSKLALAKTTVNVAHIARDVAGTAHRLLDGPN
jgi:hypothetical protein